MDSFDRALWEGEDIRSALAARDIGAVYHHLRRLGLSQRHLGRLTGQSQSEVSEILRGRQVCNVWVIERIGDGLGIPRAWLGLGYGEKPEQAPRAEEEPPAAEEVDEDVKRRALIAEASAAALGTVVIGMGEPIELALPTGQMLPKQLSMVHVHIVRAVTDHLRGVARYYGGQAGTFSAVAGVYTEWMQVPAPELVTTQLAVALAELRTEAGWCCYDEGIDGMGHFARALKLAGKAGDACGIANAAWHAGVTLVRSGHPNDALKFFQVGQIRLAGLVPGKPKPPPDDPRIPTLTARLSRNSATAHALMGGREEAIRCLAETNEGWEPRTTFERAGGDLATAGIHLDLGQLDAAEHSAASAVRTYREGHYRRGLTQAELLLAEVHIRAGEPQGLTLAHHAIEGVTTLQSLAARRERLLPLATALDARPGTDAQALARTARQIAATRI